MNIIYKAVIEQAMKTDEDFYRFILPKLNQLYKTEPEQLHNEFQKYLLGER